MSEDRPRDNALIADDPLLSGYFLISVAYAKLGDITRFSGQLLVKHIINFLEAYVGRCISFPWNEALTDCCRITDLSAQGPVSEGQTAIEGQIHD